MGSGGELEGGRELVQTRYERAKIRTTASAPCHWDYLEYVHCA